MKTKTFLGLGLLSLFGCGGSSSGGDSLTRGLIHRWQFEGNAVDSAGALNGSLVGPVQFEPAAIGQGLSLEGNSTG